ncbi:hypothetical protein SAMN05660413_00508 [Salegentibacter flavus]|uniref:Uncharacterized protein n=1 Tax=Salegentibacter flavus TaxID=287099 RepID=A0A1I4Y4A1_9FLAO|nr:hypothetical protein SAMN05660413_00508 [Salegentibacter flavus]
MILQLNKTQSTIDSAKILVDPNLPTEMGDALSSDSGTKVCLEPSEFKLR